MSVLEVVGLDLVSCLAGQHYKGVSNVKAISDKIMLAASSVENINKNVIC